jgi:hypothetical protein
MFAESDSRSTRLRYVSAQTADILALAISTMPVKVEIKGNPVQTADGRWIVWFVIPDNLPEFQNVDL